jgi:hypothetical protein
MDRNNSDIATAAIVLFVVVGVLGIDLSQGDSSIAFHNDCVDLIDNDGDGAYDSQQDAECMDYPYSDGEGENQSITVYPGSQDEYSVYDDFFNYSNLSYPSALQQGYPGQEIDWTCDLYSMGAAAYVKLYDIRYGTAVDYDLAEWFNINCIQAGNGIMANKPNNPPPPAQGEESENIEEEEIN